MDDEKELDDVLKEAIKEAEEAENSRVLYEKKMRFLGRMGIVMNFMKRMKDVPPEKRPSFGKKVNAIRDRLEEAFAAFEERLKKRELENKIAEENVDVTMPGKRRKAGALHPVSLVKAELIDIFAGMGFEIFEGPEIETDYYTFTALNTPEDHPARDMQDTFYLNDKFLLRTQTSAGQIRLM